MSKHKASQNSNNDLKNRIEQALLEQNYIHAEHLLTQLNIQNSQDKIFKTKTQAQLAIAQFQFQKAYDLYHQLQLAYPHDIEIRAEYIFTLHQLGLTIELKKQIDLFMQIWDSENKSNLSLFFKSGILIAKINEELGRFDNSFNLLETLNQTELNAYQRQAVFLQMLRIAIELKQTSFIKMNYYDLCKGIHFHKEFLIEREHILLLVNYYMENKIEIESRIQHIQSMNLASADQIFLTSEILEHHLIHHYDFAADLLDIEIPECLFYEANQFKLYRQKLTNQYSGQLNFSELQNKLSPMLMIRLLRQNMILFPNDQQIEIIYRIYQSLCEQIKPKKVSQYYLSFLPRQHSHDLIYDEKQMKLLIKNKQSLIESETYQKFIALFVNNKDSFEINEVANQIYKEELNSHHYDRIRIAVSRLNKQIQNDLLIQKLFKMNKNRLSITVNIKKAVG